MIEFTLTCGECGSPLTPNDEGSAPILQCVKEDAGMWQLDLTEMGCAGIVAAWPAFDARPNDDDKWHDEWDELCERHYSKWTLTVTHVGGVAQTGTQSVSDASDEMFVVVGTATAVLDDGGVVELEDVDIYDNELGGES